MAEIINLYDPQAVYTSMDLHSLEPSGIYCRVLVTGAPVAFCANQGYLHSTNFSFRSTSIKQTQIASGAPVTICLI